MHHCTCKWGTLNFSKGPLRGSKPSSFSACTRYRDFRVYVWVGSTLGKVVWACIVTPKPDCSVVRSSHAVISEGPMWLAACHDRSTLSLFPKELNFTAHFMTVREWLSLFTNSIIFFFCNFENLRPSVGAVKHHVPTREAGGQGRPSIIWASWATG